jgi:hypothetical protein
MLKMYGTTYLKFIFVCACETTLRSIPITLQSNHSPPSQNQNYRLCHSTYVIRRMRVLIVTSVIVFACCAVSCSNALHVCLSVRIVVGLDSHRGTLIVRWASCGDWTGPPSMTDGGHVAISCSSELPNLWESQTSNSSQKFIYCIGTDSGRCFQSFNK